MPGDKVKVLVIDDSALVREVLKQGLSLDTEIEVIGTASDPYIARDKIVKLHPDVLTLDVEMPKMDGVEFLKRLMPQYPLPVLMVSALTEKGKKITLDALEAGAVDFITKPDSDIVNGLGKMISELRAKVKQVSKANVGHWKREKSAISGKTIRSEQALDESTDKVIAVGSSAGGTEAVRKIITQFPPNMPGVVIVQHMPAGFTKMFAERLNEQCAMTVKEAENGDRVMSGQILIAPGEYHMTVFRSGGIYRVNVKQGEKVCGHMPSVEVLFKSVARYVGSNAIGIMLTGMGKDGADGMLDMRKAGARTMAQDEETSVVFGMPKEAYINGGAEILVPLQDIPEKIIRYLKDMTS